MTRLDTFKYFITEDLYIIREKEPGPTPPGTVGEERPPQKIDAKGSLAGSAFILVNDAGHEHIAPGDEQFLHKILQAVQVGPGDIAIINTAKNRVDLDFILGAGAGKILIFDPDQAVLKDPVQAYVPETLQGKTFLISDSLDELQKDQNKKRQLWKSLQEIFLSDTE